MRILVTGAGGFLGSRVMKELGGHDVIAIDNFSTAQLNAIDGREILEVDVADLGKVSSFECDMIIHLAAVSGVDECERNPEEAHITNVLGTQNMVHLCYRKGIPLIFACSAAVFGNPQSFPIKETHPRNPLNLYGLTKLAGEEMIRIFSKGRFPSYIFILQNIYGYHVVGERRIEKSSVVNKFVQAAQNNCPLTVYRPGLQARNFIHVKDAAHAFIMASEKIMEEEKENVAFNIAHESCSIVNLAEMVRKIAEKRGYSPRIELCENPREESLAEEFSVNTDKARERLGFAPRISLENSIEEMLTSL